MYDAVIALAAVSIWAALVVAEVRFKELWFFKYVFWGSLLALFVAFPAAGMRAFREHPNPGAVAAVSLLLTPVFIIIGVMLIWWFKIAIGGHPS